MAVKVLSCVFLFPLFLLGSAIQIHLPGEQEPLPELRYHVDLDSGRTFQLAWDIDPVSEEVTFSLGVLMDPDQILGFGFSDYGEATNADLAVLWKDRYGKRHFQDAHTDRWGLLHVDAQQDYVLDGAEVHYDRTNLTFHRDYDTCDDDDYVIDSGTTHIIFFLAAGPPRTIQGLNVSRIDPGLQRVQLIKSQLPVPEFPDDTWTFTMHVDNVRVPEDETTYWCKTKKLPPLPTKHHIIKFEGVITPSSRGVVHHMEVFHCELPPGKAVRNYDEPCYDRENRPMGLQACRKVIGAWAMGATALTYPEEAGYPIGGEGFSRYVMIEVHYNNPEHRRGVIDSSGIKFHVTSTLRPEDAGVMELGLQYVDKYALPPGLPEWRLDGFCIPACTRVGLKEDGIQVFASQLHTHLTGKRVYTKHFRQGIELPELNRDNHYSPHYQEIRQLPRQVHVLPGDSLVTTCIDSTLDRENVTLGGFSISDEMCVNYIHYYPKVDLELCKSSVTTESLYGFFKFMHEYQAEDTSPYKGISDNYKSIQWTPMNVRLLETFYDTAPLSMQCNQSDGTRFPGEWENRPIPKILHPMPPSVRPCLQ